MPGERGAPRIRAGRERQLTHLAPSLSAIHILGRGLRRAWSRRLRIHPAESDGRPFHLWCVDVGTVGHEWHVAGIAGEVGATPGCLLRSWRRTSDSPLRAVVRRPGSVASGMEVTTLSVNRDPRGSIARCWKSTVHRAGASTAPTTLAPPAW